MSFRANGSGFGSYSEDERQEDRLPVDLRDKPMHLLEHLATFTVNKESGIVLPADGIRRLLQLEKTTGIWSQKMQLCLDREWILIVDYETGNIIERFPATLIKKPTAFVSNSPLDMYNNVLVFIVDGGIGARAEIHIFQCQNTSAVQIVEDLKQMRSGKVIKQHRSVSIPPSPILKSSQTITHIYEHEFEESDIGVIMGSGSVDGAASRSSRFNDDASSTASEKHERDVIVLNHCFDDIEKFIARLQHAAAASRELERRKHSRKSKIKDPGEGLLMLRTKPPSEREIFDILAKFKLCFNLLAKLRAHIHDPNAPELIHFLFTPLALIVDASHDSYYPPNIPGRVIDPLLTREAINLLCNCVTSKETELWRSLGEAWTIPRDQWKRHIGSYHPVFYDGWSPDYPVIDDLDDAPYTTKYVYDSKYNPPASPGLREMSVTQSDISTDSIERNNRFYRTWLEEIQARGSKIVQCTHPRTANNDKELTVFRSEYLEVLEDSRNWWKCRNARKTIGHVPHTIITPINYNNIVVYNPLQIPNYSRHLFTKIAR